MSRLRMSGAQLAPTPLTSVPVAPERAIHLGDFTLRPRVLAISAMALIVGGASAGAAFCLLRLIALITNLVYDQRVSFVLTSPGARGHSPWLILLAPVAGGLLVGLIARFGSEKIRGHGLIPVSAAVTVATICRWAMLGAGPVFPVAETARIGGTPAALALLPGLTGGLLAVAATGLVYKSEDAFARLPVHWMWWPAIGGLIIGLGGLVTCSRASGRWPGWPPWSAA